MHSLAITLRIVLFIVAINVVGKTFCTLQSSYVIKSRQVNDIPEALTLLRRFVRGEPASPQRCEKYAIAIHMLTSSFVDQFALAELGLASKETVRNRLKGIDVETLRELYIEGINKFLESSLDPSMIELVECLGEKFKNIDAKARSFLNNPELKDTVSQYKSILEQPLDFLLDPNVGHPTLSSDELRPSVRQALLRMFNGDASQIENKFPLVHESETSIYEAASEGAPRGVVFPQRTAAASFVSGPVQEKPRAAAPRVVNRKHKVNFPTPEQAPRRAPRPAARPAARPAPRPAPKPEPKPEPEPHPQPTLEQEPVPEGLTAEEQEYMNNLIDGIGKVQQSLVKESQLNDRCNAYGNLISSDYSTLTKQLVSDIISDTLKKAQNNKNEPLKAFVPEKKLRNDFLFIVTTFGPTELGDDAWVDLVDCVSQWEQNDAEISTFIHSKEFTKEIEDVMKNAEKAVVAASQKKTEADKPPIAANNNIPAQTTGNNSSEKKSK